MITNVAYAFLLFGFTRDIPSVQTRLDDSSSKYMGKYRAHHYFLARGKASKVVILVFRVQT